MLKVINLVREKKFDEASEYGDETAEIAASENHNWHLYTKNITYRSKTVCWSACSWGNLATFIFYGEKFDDKKEEVNRLKSVLRVLSHNVFLPLINRKPKNYDEFIMY